MARKPTYRLEALLRLKRREKHQAEVALARAIMELKKAHKRKEALVAEKQRIVAQWVERRTQMAQEMDRGGMIGDGNVYVNYLRRLKEDELHLEQEIEVQAGKIVKCQEMVVRRRRGYINASKAEQVMEKHKALWRKKVMKEISRQEEKQFDELCTAMHTLRGWRGESGADAQALAH